MGSANERQCYIVTSSLIGWAHTQTDLWPYELKKMNLRYWTSPPLYFALPSGHCAAPRAGGYHPWTKVPPTSKPRPAATQGHLTAHRTRTAPRDLATTRGMERKGRLFRRYLDNDGLKRAVKFSSAILVSHSVLVGTTILCKVLMKVTYGQLDVVGSEAQHCFWVFEAGNCREVPL